jgi:tripartite ATP-independent transporter DctM subunit
VNVVANIIVAGMSGSAIADAAGVGLVAMNAMSKAGFDRAFSAGVSAAAATIGPIIPPSIPLVIFGCMTGVSVGRLFLGGFAPGLLMGLGLMITVYITSVRRGYPTQPRASFKTVLTSARGAWSAILAPIIVVGGILTGVFTPTEASVAACAYAVVVSIFLYREVSLKRLMEILAETADQTVRVLFIIAAAGLFGWLLIQQRVPEAVIQFLLSLSQNPDVILFIINAILLILGCFMEAISIMLLTIPIFMPLVAKLGIDPVHFGVMMTFNLMVALLTPPVGMVLYTVSCIGQVPLWKLASELKWHILALLVCLFLITYIPGIVTWVPNLIMG